MIASYLYPVGSLSLMVTSCGQHHIHYKEMLRPKAFQTLVWFSWLHMYRRVLSALLLTKHLAWYVNCMFLLRLKHVHAIAVKKIVFISRHVIIPLLLRYYYVLLAAYAQAQRDY